MDKTSFCEGCPFARGVQEVSQEFNVHGFVLSWPNPGFDISFRDHNDEERVTEQIHVMPGGGLDSSWPEGTAGAVLERVASCHKPEETKVKRLGGLLGSKTIEVCGAFPNQDPSKVKMNAVDTGWFNPIDFL